LVAPPAVDAATARTATRTAKAAMRAFIVDLPS
jgi:hypothetical protein